MAQGEHTAETAVDPALELPAGAEAAPETDAELAQETYSKAEVSKLISDRINKLNGKYAGWTKVEKLGLSADAVERAYNAARADAARRQTQPAVDAKPAAPPETEQDRQARAWFESKYPQIKTVETIEQRLQQMERAYVTQHVRASVAELKSLVKEAGLPDSSFDKINDMVAGSIAMNREDLAAFQAGDRDVVKKHFTAVQELLKTAGIQKTVDYAKGKEAGKNLPKRMPGGGIPAPTSNTKPMSEKEMLDAAFARLNE